MRNEGKAFEVGGSEASVTAATPSSPRFHETRAFSHKNDHFGFVSPLHSLGPKNV
jgi:hypothetical protein